ncbi:hypothetical protein [Paenibacillus durus]|uniref:Uncharacterized protein n=1 Tax=Paenibacillus durus ATCC 35681 TaxID=1333534 RepID=A0A0F7F8U1_PAEDU|nr:hypothetical protein [Paenibacillus durus]AKG34657.1 hypothetical protein VK70_08755 [Paenibacillus durus ATCC 35681]
MYPIEEQEVTAVYDPIDDEWTVYSSCRKYITKLLKVAGEPYWKEEEIGRTGTVRIVAGKWKLAGKQIRFGVVPASRPISEEERQARRDRLANARNLSP